MVGGVNWGTVAVGGASASGERNGIGFGVEQIDVVVGKEVARNLKTDATRKKQKQNKKCDTL